MKTSRGAASPGGRKVLAVALDALILLFCAFAALLTKYAPEIETDVFYTVLMWTPALIAIYILVFAVFGMYRVLWKYSGGYQLLKQVMVAVVGFGITIVINIAFSRIKGYRPLSNNYLITYCMFAIVGVLVSRMTMLAFGGKQASRLVSHAGGRRILVVGAGDAGAHLVEMFNKSRDDMGSVEVIVDDDESKRGFSIGDVPVMCSTSDIPSLVDSEDITDIIIALPTASKERLSEISALCLGTGCFVRVMDKLKRVVDDV